ncbi:MAG: FxDxF family PEP-CTERM protein [Sulfuritalea sp.]|nr:FxDxF family PEP-CTERM protein [Sulfuritalea sp.]
MKAEGFRPNPIERIIMVMADKIAAAFALLFSAGVACAAVTHDRTIDLGLLATANIGNTFSVGATGVAQGDGFIDTYLFRTTHGGSFAQAAIVSFDFSNLFGIDNLTIGFSDIHGIPLASASFGATDGGNSSFGSLTLDSPPLSAGADYRFIVSGAINAQGGGSYGGVLAIPIPEPETYLLMLAGLGLVGYAARRGRARAHLHCGTASVDAVRSAASA